MNRISKTTNIVLSALIALTMIFATVHIDAVHAAPLAAPNSTLNRFVSPFGVDAGDCSDYSNPCLTINYAISQAASTGETVGIAEGVYTRSGTEVVYINKNINLSGGWSSDFAARTGYSTIDAENVVGRKGIRIPYSVPEHNVLIEYVIIEHGSSDSSGAGIYSAANLTLQNVDIHDNQGDGIYQWTGDLTVIDSAIYDNGNGIALSANQIGVQLVQISNSTISNNTGFGIKVDMSTTLAITGSTITNNGMTGIAIYYSQAQVTVKNSILAGNGYYSSSLGDCTGTGATINSLGNNIVQVIPVSCQITSTIGDQFGVDPLLGTFLSNAGYHPLTAGSPAINAGNSASCSDHDQRGLPRGASCDIGAYEYTVPGSAATIQIVSGEGQHLGPDMYFFRPIKVVILDANGSPVPGETVTFSGPAGGPGAVFTATGTNSITLTTDAGGVAAVNSLYSNSITGPFSIQALSAVGSIYFHVVIEIWYLSANGSDSNDCMSPSTPCVTLGRIVHSPDFVYHSVVWITSDTFDLGELYFAVSKTAKFEGGWNSDFTEQNGYTHIQGHVDIIESGFLGDASVTFNRFEFTPSPEDSINSVSAALRVDFNQGLLIQNSYIHDNRKGITISGGTAYVINTTISNNRGGSQSGGGIEVNGGFLRVINSTISGNGELGYSMGGGIYFGGAAEVLIWNSTITGNKARDGGGILNGGGPGIFGAIANTIIAGNVDSGGIADDPDCRGRINSFGHNLIGNLGKYQNYSLCDFVSSATDLLGTYETPIPVESILRTALIQDPTTLLWYHPLIFGSLAIEAGSPEIPGSTDTSCPAKDQIGVSRPQGQTCDMGAVEYVFDSTHPPLTFKKSAPINGSSGIAPNPTISWDVSGGATTYDYCYDITNDNSCTNWISSGANTSASLSGLTPSTTYYWHVRAVNLTGTTYSNGSATAFWSFTTAAAPGGFNKSSPTNNALHQVISPTLKWGASTGATSYEYCVNKNSPTCITWVPVTGTSAFVANNLDYNGIYYWQVRAVGPGGVTYANSGSWWKFTVVMPSPELVSPGVDYTKGSADNIHTRRPTFTWNVVPGATGYTLEVSTTNTFSSKAINTSPKTNNYTHTTDLAAGTIYFWRVKANGTNGPSAYSQIYTFKTGNPPGVPSLSAPASNALTSLRPFFDWTDSSGSPHHYELQLATNSAFTTDLQTITNIPASNYTPASDLLAGKKYYWRVRSVNADTDASAWTTSRYFRTPASAPTLIGPPLGSTVSNLKPTFSWLLVAGATQYRIQISTSANFASMLVNATTASLSYTPVSNLPANSLLYWRVQVSMGGNTPGLWSTVFEFHTP